MIYSRFGTRMTLLTQADGQGYCKAVFHHEAVGDEKREIHRSEMKADNGAAEIEGTLATLPAFPRNGTRATAP